MSLVQLIFLTLKQQLYTFSKYILLPADPARYGSRDLCCIFLLVKFASLDHLQPLDLRAVITLLLPFKTGEESGSSLDTLNPGAKILFCSG